MCSRLAPPPRILVVGALAILVCLPGCVRRRMTVRSDPPGALVYVDEQEIGTTPVSTSFTYFGTRKIQLVKDGCETLTVRQSFSPPWYEIPPLDLISENLWPHELRSEHLVTFQLQPQPMVPTDRLLERAEAWRGEAWHGHAAAVPNATATPQPILPLPSGPPAAPRP